MCSASHPSRDIGGMLTKVASPMRSSTQQALGTSGLDATVFTRAPVLYREGTMDQEQQWLSWPVLDDGAVYDDIDLLALIMEE
jgi:hypothetical protein